MSIRIPSATIKVLIADDQALMRAGFRALIEHAPDLLVAGEAATGRAAAELARQTRADVVLMDIRMPDLDGLAATRLITADEDLVGARVNRAMTRPGARDRAQLIVAACESGLVKPTRP